MQQTGRAAPIAHGDRVHLLDALRGFALLGVFVANMHSFSGWFMLGDARQAALAGTVWPEIEGALLLLLVDGKFYTIFSLLFGVGFALQLDRLERRGDGAAARFARRMGGLLAIGLCHLVLVWYGDILTLYALAGLVLLAVRGWSDRRLLAVAAGLILLPVPGAALVHWLGVSPNLGMSALSDRAASALLGGPVPTDIVSWMASPGWGHFTAWQWSSAIWRVGSLAESWRPAKVIAIMMIGLWTGRRLIDGTLFADRTRLRRVLICGLAIGLPGNLLMTVMGGIEGHYGVRVTLAEIGYALGVVPLGLAYAAAFALAWPRQLRLLGVFAPVGRMALTNYLSQSVISVLIFHGIGLGLAGTMGPGAFLTLAVAIFAAQALVTRWWLARFGQGPVERLWRWMTYGRVRAT
jgi:uncharacterized protein